MKPLLGVLLFVAALLLLGLVYEASAALPWYYKLVIAAPFAVILFLVYSVIRRRRT